MKKIGIIFLLVLVLSLLMTAAFAEDHEFEGISYVDPTQIHELGGHEVSKPVLMHAATCSQKALYRFTCEVDKTHFHEEYLAEYPYGHDLVKISSVAATCTEAGSTSYKCKVCGEIITKTTKALGHQWSSKSGDKAWGKVIKEATCSQTGEAVDYCLRCGLVNENIRVIDAIEHTFIQKVDVKANCQNDGHGHVECKFCGLLAKDYEDYDPSVLNCEAEYIIPSTPNAHDWDKWIVEKEADCFSAARSVRWCKICGAKQEHEGKLDPKSVIEKWIATTRVDNPKITYVISDSTLIDCFTQQITYVCPLCNGKADGHYYVETKAVTAHTYIQEKKYFAEHKDPTCEEDGYDAYYCFFDKDHDLGYFYIPATGHDWTEWEERYAPGVAGNEYGYWIRECLTCGKTEERISKTAPVEACEKTGHDWTFKVIAEATCTEAGETVKTCTICGTVETIVLPAEGHAFIETITAEATCAADGEKVITCANCDYTETVVIEKSADSHVWNEGVVTTEATPDAAGEKTYTCDICGETKTEEVEFVATADPAYTISSFDYDGEYAVGILVHDAATKEADKLYVRLTVFYANGATSISVSAVEDGIFEAGISGDVVHISLVITGTAHSIRPDGSWIGMGSYEF